tara:strand:- start:379 stop:504 length:126 start_codon:yes stop_codon:yes gene_type:complete
MFNLFKRESVWQKKVRLAKEARKQRELIEDKKRNAKNHPLD